MSSPAGSCIHCFAKFADEAARVDHDASRNIRKCEVLASALWGAEYARKRQSARCFFRSLDNSRKYVVRDILKRIQEAKS